MTDIPDSTVPIQEEAVESTRPVSESSQFAQGGAINYCLKNGAKIGDVEQSILSLAQFQALRGTTWVLMDGGTSLVGTDPGNLTGLTVVPDARATYLRMCDAAASRDPNGSQTPGTYLADVFATHTHTTLTYAGSNVSGGSDFACEDTSLPGTATSGSTGGNETRPKTMYVNFFIKINT